MKNNKPLICIVGPTACGKTDLSIAVAKKLNGVCINADATQFYKHLDLATNKITESEKEGIQHLLLSFLELDETFSVAEYQTIAMQKIEEVFQKNKIPILVGGSGLYVNSVIYDYHFSPIDNLKKAKLENKYQNYSNTELYDLLLNIDKNFSDQIHINNRKQMISHLIYYDVNNKTKLKKENNGKQLNYNAIIIYLKPDRSTLYNKIQIRLDNLIKKGLIDEIRQVLKLTNHNMELQSMKTIGCKEIKEFLDNNISLEQAKMKMIKANWHYARKQMIWFNYQITPTITVEYKLLEFDVIKEELICQIQNLLKKY
ncbi:tRNA (adenosine(37)-N6)-dimethylallyltransferase MiaA [Spiroplasma endosymbiont of Amphibalanus improvisus]|uniref:tRNA (adenosine(37)-N6)-dimethylallyltransferase MiaA n=1 Tax=Spiroplasma endosymbiont of Amphibalanus improvisus TaxID=3066327 RepID=UPI00313ED9DD